MQISGINRFSLLDYPGEISCVIFTPGCNLRCGYCHNSEFVLPEKLKHIYKQLIPEDTFFSFLQMRKKLLTGVSICGGEPTLQKDLKNFCKKLKKQGYKVKLDTNGHNPNILKELIEENLVDYIAMDIKHEPGKLSSIVGVSVQEDLYEQSKELIMNSLNIEYEFRTTAISGIHDENTIRNICESINGSKRYAIQNYRTGNTLDKKFIGESFTKIQLEGFGKIAQKYVNEVVIRD